MDLRIITNDCHKCLILRVKDRTKETLTGLILEHVPKSARITIVSDGWALYQTLQDLCYKHAVVVHQEKFANSDGFHTNSIESVWSQLKVLTSSMHGVRKNHMDSYLCEFMFRYNNTGSGRGNCWKYLIEGIQSEYKC